MRNKVEVKTKLHKLDRNGNGEKAKQRDSDREEIKIKTIIISSHWELKLNKRYSGFKFLNIYVYFALSRRHQTMHRASLR